MENLSATIGEAAALLIPCGVVNISLNLLGAVKRIGGIDRFDPPFDLGMMMSGRRLLGKSTTWGGLALAVIVGGSLQLIAPNVPGLVVGLGTFFGHALGSFVKRRAGVPDGVYMPVVDHGDYVMFTGAALLIAGKLGAAAYIVSVVAVLAIHPLFCLMGYWLGIRTSKL